MGDLVAIEICCGLAASFSPLIDLRSALRKRMTGVLACITMRSEAAGGRPDDKTIRPTTSRTVGSSTRCSYDSTGDNERKLVDANGE